MKERYWAPYEIIIDYYKPKTICEIGTHNGRSAVQFCKAALKNNYDVIYTGYDLFDLASEETHKEEHNGKGSGDMSRAKKYLDVICNHYPKFKYTLHRGFTQDTLTDAEYDFVYVDGGHSYESVMFDYSKIKNSKLIFFDDYQIKGVREAVQEIDPNHLELKVDCNKGKRRQAAIIKDFDPIKDKVIADLFL